MIERYTPSRRRATLVAFLLDLEERLTDSALEMADKLIGGVFTREKCPGAQLCRHVEECGAADADLSKTIDALTDAVDTGEDPSMLWRPRWDGHPGEGQAGSGDHRGNSQPRSADGRRRPLCDVAQVRTRFA
jgi:hypothetical protein